MLDVRLDPPVDVICFDAVDEAVGIRITSFGERRVKKKMMKTPIKRGEKKRMREMRTEKRKRVMKRMKMRP